MLLAGLTEEPGWIRSSFNLTYRVPWEKLIQGVRGVYPYIEDAEVQVDGESLHFSAPEDLLAIPEASSIMIRGMSPILKAPIMLTFFNQKPFINVAIGRVNEEFQTTDYEKFNKSMCQFMDSIEIMMHVPPATLPKG